jgi:hypothetical protein
MILLLVATISEVRNQKSGDQVRAPTVLLTPDSRLPVPGFWATAKTLFSAMEILVEA